MAKLFTGVALLCLLSSNVQEFQNHNFSVSCEHRVVFMENVPPRWCLFPQLLGPPKSILLTLTCPSPVYQLFYFSSSSIWEKVYVNEYKYENVHGVTNTKLKLVIISARKEEVQMEMGILKSLYCVDNVLFLFLLKFFFILKYNLLIILF